jgi:hypothetical protein
VVVVEGTLVVVVVDAGPVVVVVEGATVVVVVVVVVVVEETAVVGVVSTGGVVSGLVATASPLTEVPGTFGAATVPLEDCEAPLVGQPFVVLAQLPVA